MKKERNLCVSKISGIERHEFGKRSRHSCFSFQMKTAHTLLGRDFFSPLGEWNLFREGERERCMMAQVDKHTHTRRKGQRRERKKCEHV